MGPGWYGVGVKDESRPDQSDARPEAPAAERGATPSSRIRGSAFFSSVDASMLGLGSQMMSEVVAGVLLGLGLDYMLGTRNRWVVVGSIAGVAVAMVTVVRVAMRPQTPRRRPPGSRVDASPGTDSGPEQVSPQPSGQDEAKR
jgi:F0F1-type ATP synthase assembly protein I